MVLCVSSPVETTQKWHNLLHNMKGGKMLTPPHTAELEWLPTAELVCVHAIVLTHTTTSITTTQQRQ